MKYIERDIEHRIKESLDSEKALFILGARQVGKTTLLKRIREIVGNDVSLYYDIEIPENLELFSGPLEKIIARLRFDRKEEGGRTYVFLDEIQYLKDFSKMVKILTDHYAEEFKLVMTGSSSALIKHQFSESLAGRKQVLTLYPLSFAEFCLFKGEDNISRELSRSSRDPNHPLYTLSGRMEQLMAEYMVYGGYPEVVSLPGHEKKTELLKELVTSFVLKDIKHLLQIEKLEELNRLIITLAMSIGKEVNISELSRNVGLHRETVQRYLQILEESFIISLLRPFFSSLDKELRKMPKVYMIDTGIRNMLINEFGDIDSRSDRGELAESFFHMTLLRNKTATTEINFWKTRQGGEIDFVLSQHGKILAYEIKFGNDSSNNFVSFKNAYPEADCYMVRYKYKYKTNELPLWSRIE